MTIYAVVSLLLTIFVQASEVTSQGRGIPQYNVDEAAIANGPLNNISTQNLCNGDQSFSVYADRDLISRGGRALQTCEMMLNPFFAQLIKAFIPKCAKEAAVKNGMSLPTSVSIEQMGGYASRNARNSTKRSRHSHGMALDVSAIRLHSRDMLGRESTRRIELTGKTSNQAFYDSFRSCWNAAVVEGNGRNCTCSIGHEHTHDPSNALHNDHMHISLSCPSSPGTTNCSNEKKFPKFISQVGGAL
jgi:hypothetical protein